MDNNPTDPNQGGGMPTPVDPNAGQPAEPTTPETPVVETPAETPAPAMGGDDTTSGENPVGGAPVV